MPNPLLQQTLSALTLAAVLIFGTGCSQGTVTPPTTIPSSMPEAAPSPLPPTQAPTKVPPTWTPTTAPTSTATQIPTMTATVTATATLGPAEDGFSAWCLPELASLATTNDPAHPPAEAKMASWSGTALEVNNLPSNGCVFIYKLNREIRQSLRLEVFDRGDTNAFLATGLIPVPSDPNAVYTVLRHSYIITPPVWNVTFTFVVTTENGDELRRDTVNLHRWIPVLCWNGQPPNPVTLRCPLQQDLHPWDPSYGTPFPTSLPEED